MSTKPFRPKFSIAKGQTRQRRRSKNFSRKRRLLSRHYSILNAELEFAKLPPLSNPPTEGENKTLLVKKFAIETAGRAWWVKFGALQQFGRAPSRPGHTCPIEV